MNPIRGKDDVITKFPLVGEAWDYEKNEVDPTLGSSSKTEVYLRCKKGHSFKKSIRAFLLTPKCPVCDLEQNSIVAVKPGVVDWWDYEKNGDDRPEFHYKTEAKKVWWKCPKCGYSWQSEIASRKAGKDMCPCCDLGIAFMRGVNDAATKCPEIVRDWDFEKNIFTPQECFIQTKETVYWKCGICGYQWTGHLYGHLSRQADGSFKLRKCKFCDGKVTFSGAKNFATEHPELAKEYVPKLNAISLENLMVNSGKKINWQCSICKQIFSSAPATRVGSGRSGKGCPYCDHKLPIKGDNDLRTWCKANSRTDLLLEWDSVRNNHLPEDYYYSSRKSVHWRCTENPEHIWDASIYDRITSHYRDCPICNDFKARQKFNVAHPELLKYWDYEKNKFGPGHYNEFSNEEVFWRCEEGHSFQSAIFRFSEKGFYCPVCDQFRLFKGVNDLKTLFPDLVTEWSSQNELPPDEYLPNSNKAVWWSCLNGHPPYLRPVRDRTTDKNPGCPVCMKSGVALGINDAKSHYPELERIWDYKQNNGKGPEKVSFESTRQFQFVCSKGHHWTEGIPAVTNAGCTCAICTGRKPLLGVNTLLDLHPDIAELWDNDSPYNEGISPSSVTTVKGVKYAWICKKCRHSYLATIPEKINDERECPYCQSIFLDPKMNSFHALYPDLAKEYSSENKRPPDQVFPTHYNDVKWNCPACNQMWYAKIKDRMSGEAKCPYCSRKYFCPGISSLKSLYPDIASEFWTDNNIDPDTISPKAWLRAHWNCSKCGQTWPSIVSQRISGAKKCPYCDGKFAIPGKTSFKVLNPEIAEEFSSDNDRDPDTILPTSSMYSVWNCRKCKQTWGGSVADRVNGLATCPYCDGRKAIPGETSLMALYPQLMGEWNELANLLSVNPNEILPKSTMNVWWTCFQCGYSYTARIKDKVRDILRNRNACPHCNGYRRTKHYII